MWVPQLVCSLFILFLLKISKKMRLIISCIFLLSLTCMLHAQEIKKLSQQQMDSIAQASDEIYDLVEVMPQFPGGQDSLRSYLKINTRMPQADIMGKVYLSFVVKICK